MRRILLAAGGVLLALVVIAAVCVPPLWQHVMADYDRDHQPESIETIPVYVHMMPGSPNEQILRGSSLIEYKGEPRMIVSRERDKYAFDDISEISVSISKMGATGPYCVELQMPRSQYDLAANETIEKAEAMGLKVGCGQKAVLSKACPNAELSGIRNHPVTATAMESADDFNTHLKSAITYKMARDSQGLLYTYKTQEEDGIPRQQFEIDDAAHHTNRIWNQGDEEGQLLVFDADNSHAKLLELKTLGKKQMEGFDVEGNSLSCSLGPGVVIRYEAWASEVLATYVDLVTETTSLRQHTHFSDIHPGEDGLKFFKPPTGMKFVPPGATD
jgi:hypothetical protein